MDPTVPRRARWSTDTDTGEGTLGPQVFEDLRTCLTSCFGVGLTSWGQGSLEFSGRKRTKSWCRGRGSLVGPRGPENVPRTESARRGGDSLSDRVPSAGVDDYVLPRLPSETQSKEKKKQKKRKERERERREERKRERKRYFCPFSAPLCTSFEGCLLGYLRFSLYGSRPSRPSGNPSSLLGAPRPACSRPVLRRPAPARPCGRGVGQL